MAKVLNKCDTYARLLDINVLSKELIIHQKFEGNVNCVVWDAAIVLGKYLEELYKRDPNCLKGLRIIELGSGLGSVGLIAASLGANVLLTDLSEAIPLLQFNIDENKLLCSGSVRALALEWGHNIHLKHQTDKILLADCVYYRESVEPLISTLRYYASERTEIILAQELRDTDKQKEIWQYFLDNLTQYFRLIEIPLSEQNIEYSSPDIVILKLYKI